MKMIFAFVGILSFIAIVFTASAEANTCFSTRACSTSNPCVYVPDNPDLDPEIPPTQNFTCGRGCKTGVLSGGIFCTQTPDPFTDGRCLMASIQGPGCCTAPCQPPAIGCEPN